MILCVNKKIIVDQCDQYHLVFNVLTLLDIIDSMYLFRFFVTIKKTLKIISI